MGHWMCPSAHASALWDVRVAGDGGAPSDAGELLVGEARNLRLTGKFRGGVNNDER